MKKSIFAAVAGLSLFLSACTSKPFLPENPKDKEEKEDENGNRWVYNAHGAYWMFFPYNSARSSAYSYYPGSGVWTNSSGVKVDPPANLPRSFKPNSPRMGTSKSSATSGKVFGKSVRPRSFGG